MAIIDVKHLSYQYEKQTTNVLDDIIFKLIVVNGWQLLVIMVVVKVPY